MAISAWNGYNYLPLFGFKLITLHCWLKKPLLAYIHTPNGNVSLTKFYHWLHRKLQKNLRCSLWWKYSQNDNIPVWSVIVYINVEIQRECALFSVSCSMLHLMKKLMMTSSNGNIFRVTGPLCGEFTGPGEFPTQRPVTRNFDIFFDLRLNKRLSKQPWGWWFETP